MNFNTTKVLFKRLKNALMKVKTEKFQYYKSTLQTMESEWKWRVLKSNFNTTKVLFKRFVYYRQLVYRRPSISILQKYSSNWSSQSYRLWKNWHFNTTKVLFKRKDTHKISRIFQNFNTTKVLFKQIQQLVEDDYGELFQYYKSTLQTDTCYKGCNKGIVKFQYYKSTLQTRRARILSSLLTTISILQKYSSNVGGVEARAERGSDFNTTKVLFKRLLASAWRRGAYKISILQKYSSNMAEN